MSQNKYKLPDDVRFTVLGYVRGYKRRLAAYLQAREEILLSSPDVYTTYKDENGVECRQYNGHSGSVCRPVENKQERLERLELSKEVGRMRAVEKADVEIGLDIKSDEVRWKLKKAIKLSCESGRKYPYRALDVPGVSEDRFYDYKRKYLYTIAVYDGLI